MKRQSVLIVEDDSAIRELYQTALTEAGLEVQVAQTGAAGVETALSFHPNVILMDIMLPDMNGHKAVEKIRLDNWGRTAKIIFLTNRSDAEDVVQAVALGSDEYIIKAHTTPKELVNQVRAVAEM